MTHGDEEVVRLGHVHTVADLKHKVIEGKVKAGEDVQGVIFKQVGEQDLGLEGGAKVKLCLCMEPTLRDLQHCPRQGGGGQWQDKGRKC